MLSELKDILDRLQTGNFAESPQQQRAGRMMKDLSDLVSKQQKLLDDTFKAKREQQQNSGGDQNQAGQFEVSPPGQPMDFGNGLSMAPLFEMPGETEQGGSKTQGPSGERGQPRQPGQAEMGEQPQGGQPGQHGELAQRQEELRDTLQGLIDRFRIEGADESATQSQTAALDHLRKGAQSMAEQMMQNGEAQAGQGPGNNGRDPLGRPDRANRPDLGLSVKVPD